MVFERSQRIRRLSDSLATGSRIKAIVSMIHRDCQHTETVALLDCTDGRVNGISHVRIGVVAMFTERPKRIEGVVADGSQRPGRTDTDHGRRVSQGRNQVRNRILTERFEGLGRRRTDSVIPVTQGR